MLYKDLKASHVFVDTCLRVCLIDFGLCEQTQDTLSSQPAGTFHAMSPEMLELFLHQHSANTVKTSCRRVGIEHDFFTLGVLLYEFLFPHKIQYFVFRDIESAEGFHQIA